MLTFFVVYDPPCPSSNQTPSAPSGYIDVQLWHCTGPKRVNRTTDLQVDPSPEITEVGEKAVKGKDISHKIGKEEGNLLQSASFSQVSYCENRPYHTFRFHYWTRCRFHYQGAYLCGILISCRCAHFSRNYCAAVQPKARHGPCRHIRERS